MKNSILKLSARLLAGAALALAAPVAYAQPVIFTDNFSVNSSANWLIYSNSTDFKAQFAFRYGTNTFSRGGVATNLIPLAPSSTPATETNGLKLAVNDISAAITAINLYPAGQTFSNDYALKFDLWLNYTGTGFGNGTGGTEDAIFGINHVGDKNVFRASGAALSPVGDGVSFAVDTDGDIASQDYQAYIGDNINPLVELQGASGGFLDRDGDSIPEAGVDAGQPATFPLKLMFPSPAYETAGMPSKQWVRVELRQRTNSLGDFVSTWLIEGYVIAEHTQSAAYGQTNGNIMIGLMDPFAGVGSPTNDSFILYDNVRVVNLSNFPTNEIVSIVATDPSAAEPSGDDGLITISRTGSTASPLTVPFRVAGTATRGSDYVTQTNGVTFTTTNVVIPAGSDHVDVVIHVLDDSIGETTESAVIALVGNPNAYDIREAMFARVDIADDGDVPTASITTFRPAAYEGNTNNFGQFFITLSTPYNADVTVNYTTSGTATNGIHYISIPSSVVIPANTTTNSVFILALQNSDTVSNRIVTLTLAPGTGYTNGVVNTNASVVIYNDDPTPAATGTLFSDAFEVDSSANWNINASAAVCDAAFAFDYSTVGIPPAPHSAGTTLGLKLRANSPLLGAATFSGISVSPKNQNFTGDFRLRYDMWLNFPGAFPGGGAGSTQLGTAGITSGSRSIWPGGAITPRDSVYFAIDGDGGTTPDVRIYTNGSAVLPTGSGVYSAGTQASAGNTEDAYYSIFGRTAAPADQLALFPSQTGLTAVGAPGMAWHDVVVTKLGNTLTWTIDGLSIAAVNAAKLDFTLSTNIFVGQTDINSGQTSVALDATLFALVDNLVVESLPAPTIPVITNISLVAGPNVQVSFTGSTNDFPTLFLLMSSTNVAGPYINVNATVTGLAPGAFRAVTPYTNNAARFYRILR
jgi:hypothetical protein